MQPVQIRVNAAVVLVVLLLAVPLQLFLSHYISQVYANSSHTAIEFKGPSKLGPSAGEKATIEPGLDTTETKGIKAARVAAISKLSSQLSSLMNRIRRTFKYYSTWNHMKELFVVPYRRKPKDSAKITLRKSGSKSEVVINTKSQSGKGTSSSGTTNTRGGAIRTGNEQLTGQKLKFGATAKKLKEVPPTSRAKEVEDYLFQEVYFTHSKEPRTVRPRGLAFHVGQVVRHKMDNYHGVVVGWDTVAKAPEEWIKRHYSKRPGIVDSPHYLVLVDSRYDASGVPYHYLPQEDLEEAPHGMQVRAPELETYFEGFSNNYHTARPWLRKRYPKG